MALCDDFPSGSAFLFLFFSKVIHYVLPSDNNSPKWADYPSDTGMTLQTIREEFSMEAYSGYQDIAPRARFEGTRSPLKKSS